MAVKTVHSLIWLSVETAVAYLIFAGLTKRSGRSVAVAGAVVLGESFVYLANGARCPLTGLAESLGAESGSVTDSYLPTWLARNLPALHVPVVVLIVYLHRKRLLPGAVGPAASAHPQPASALFSDTSSTSSRRAIGESETPRESSAETPPPARR